MANTTNPNRPQIVYSCVSKRIVEGEIFISQHVIDYIISGSSEVHFNGQSYLYEAGDIRFAVKNRLSRFVKQPSSGGEYRSISICIDHNTLVSLKDSFADKLAKNTHLPQNVFLLKSNTLFKNYFDSLIPYLHHSQQMDIELLRAKIKEAVLVFLDANPTLIGVLFDFNEPGKIDLQAYMDEHYRYNGDLQNFAYLTGRSLSTFKRDFEKIYNMTPSRWLLRKRLEDAYYLLSKKKIKASEVYLEVGFKDYSHFFVAFKKMYGLTPSMV